MKILTSKSTDRSSIAQLLRSNGGFKKEKGKYIYGNLEIWFLDPANMEQSHIDWADVVCGCYYNRRVRDLALSSGKLVDENIINLIQYEIYGSTNLWQVVTYNNDHPSLIRFELRKIKVFDYQVEICLKYKQCFYTEQEATEYAHKRVKEEIEKCKETLIYLEKMEKDWERTLKSF